jgi:hypothetical protein
MRPEPLEDACCVLPGGLVTEDGRCRTRAELRPLTGREEEWLASHSGTPRARIVTHLLRACLVRLEDQPPEDDLPARLLVGDRDYLMLHLRRLTLGDAVRAVVTCPACGAKMDVDFATSAIPVARLPQTASACCLTLEGEGRAGRAVRFRLPCGADQEAVAEMEEEQAVETLLARCLLDDGGVALAPDEREQVIAEMERRAPRSDLELDLACPECGHAFLLPFDMTAFFLQELRVNGAQLLREVHLLALYYHWSEAEILGLRRDRRRAYLALLSDTLRPE